MNDDNFFSIDRLVEFGLGMGIAQQMVNSMNQALKTVHVPGPMNGLVAPLGQAASVAPAFYLVLEGKQAGPFTQEELSRLIAQGSLAKSTFAWRAGMANWERCENIPEILKLVALCPPPLPPEAQV